MEPRRSAVDVAVIGGGFAGTMVTVALLRAAPAGSVVRLLERSPRPGGGVAYGTGRVEHLLNVPAGKMGAFPDRPGDFLRWLGERAGRAGVPERVAPTDFLPRSLYGDYLREILDEAVRENRGRLSFGLVRGEAVDLAFAADRAEVRLADGRTFAAADVVLALGNLPPADPLPAPLPIYASSRYVRDLWHAADWAESCRDGDVLLLGSGLTAVDAMLQLVGSGHRGVIHALSRHGLRPHTHQPADAYADFLAGEEPPRTIRGVVARVRREVAVAGRSGIGWRPVLDAIRPHTQRLWTGLSAEERDRFLRHVRPLWEVHRHRLAPQVATRVEELRGEGRVRFLAGRIDSLEEDTAGAVVRYRERGTGAARVLRVERIVNCTGPRSDYGAFPHPLLEGLRGRGWITAGPANLGLQATAQGEVLDRQGRPVAWLHTLGAPLKGVLWETTAVPELRGQAAALARRLAVRSGG